MTEIIKSEQPAFTQAQIGLIKKTVAKGATDDELALFIGACKRTGLDPFARQIYFIKRKQGADYVGTFQVAIDGYRAIAERTGAYAGNDDPAFEYSKTKKLKSGDPVPERATVTVHKIVDGQPREFTASARWSEYCPPQGMDFMWQKMPHVMLGKVAEALALRKAFPNELSGLYTHEEMAQASKPDQQPHAAAPVAKAEPAAAVEDQAPDDDLPVIEQDADVTEDDLHQAGLL